MTPARVSEWGDVMAKARSHDCVPVRRPTRSTFSIPPAPPASPRAWCATTTFGGHVVALKYTMKAISDVDAGDVYWAASDVGWVVGHFLHCLCASLQGLHQHSLRRQAGRHARCRRVLAGDQPAYGVKALFTAPTAFRAIKREDPTAALMKKYDLSRSRRFITRRRATGPGHPALGAGRSLAECR